jgi:hypothetical protein
MAEIISFAGCPAPPRTEIRLVEGDVGTARIEIPKPRFRAVHFKFLCTLVGVVVVLAWLGTRVYRQGVDLFLPFALFSVALSFLFGGGFANAVLGRQVIGFGQREMRIEKIRPFFSRCHIIAYSSIEHVSVDRVVPRGLLDAFNHLYLYLMQIDAIDRGRALRGPINLPTVSWSGGQVCFAESVTDAEKQWLANVINHALRPLTTRRRAARSTTTRPAT